MQYIDINTPHNLEARDHHFEVLRFIIRKKIEGVFFKEDSPIAGIGRINKVNGIRSEVAAYLKNEENLKRVLIGTPDELDSIKLQFTSKGTKKSLKKLLNYEAWVKTDVDSTYRSYNAYNLAEKLRIPTCIYCNRIYTKTVITNQGKKITRPTFDHWFPKSEFPLLALSFYNLIPSCSICNSGVKGATPFSLSTHFNPYFKNSNLDNKLGFTFSYDHRDYDKFTFKILTSNNFSKKSVEAFQLEEIYKAHEEEIEDLRKIRDTYSDGYLDILEKNVLNGITDRDEIYRLAFGVHINESKFHQRPLSKMKKDILIELGIIKSNKRP